MNFQNLQYFLIVTEEMNVTRAAKRLHISEQALSRQIGKLEKELGAKLFERYPRFTLSPAGKRLKAAAEQIGTIERQLHLELDDLNHNNTGELRIGVSYTRGQALLPRLLPPFHQKHPGITVTILEGSSSELQDNLSKGRIDLFIGYVPRDLDAFEAAEIGRERLFLVVPKPFMEELFGERADEMRRTFAEGVDITVFKDLPFILLDREDRVRRMADRLFSRYDITPPDPAGDPEHPDRLRFGHGGHGSHHLPGAVFVQPFPAPLGPGCPGRGGRLPSGQRPCPDHRGGLPPGKIPLQRRPGLHRGGPEHPAGGASVISPVAYILFASNPATCVDGCRIACIMVSISSLFNN